MIQNVVTSIILYSGTAVDLLIILMLFFAKRKSRKDIINIYLGQFLGSVSLIFLSLLFAFVLIYIPSKEILGLLGLIPIFLGLKVLLLGDSDGEAIGKHCHPGTQTTLKTQQDETSTTNSGADPGPGRLLFSEEAIQSSPSSGPSCASPSFRW